MNKVMLIGRIGTDLDLRFSKTGEAYLFFSLATSKKFKKDSEVVTKTEWHKLVCFKKTAELIEKYCNKGDQLFIEGELKTTINEKDDGTKTYHTNIVVNNVQFLSVKDKDDSDKIKESNKERKKQNKSDTKSGQSTSSGLCQTNSEMIEDVFGFNETGNDFNEEELPF